jgi:group I intron endonuclease
MVIYKIINLINGKYYIGKDQNNIPNYYGSGLLIKKAIKKYGKENFKKIILSVCSSIKDMNKQEKKFINETVLKDPNSYNLMLSGSGGDTYSYRNEIERLKYHKNMSAAKSGKNHHMYGKSRTEIEQQNISKGLKKYFSEIGYSEKSKKKNSIKTKESWKNGRKPKIEIEINGIIYKSCRSASIKLNICRHKILQNCKDNRYINYKILN